MIFPAQSPIYWTITGRKDDFCLLQTENKLKISDNKLQQSEKSSEKASLCEPQKTANTARNRRN